MAHDKEEQARLIRQASKKAIALAMEGRWREAVGANKEILETFPNDIDTLNRLGRAYLELGEYAEARAAYQRAKELDAYNSIADKNLRRLALLDGGKEGAKAEGSTRLEPNYFIEETGKAGVVRLQQLGPREVLARMVAGDKVTLEAANGNLRVTNEEGDFLGVVETRHGQRLARLMAGGNRYVASVTSSTEDSLAVIIREVYQHPDLAGQLSFPSKGLDSARLINMERMPHRHSDYDETSPEDEQEYGLNPEEEEVEPESLEEEESEQQ